MAQIVKFLDSSNLEDETDKAIVDMNDGMLGCLLDELVEKAGFNHDGPEVAEIQNVLVAAFSYGSFLADSRGITVQEVDEADDFPFEDDDQMARVCRMQISE